MKSILYAIVISLLPLTASSQGIDKLVWFGIDFSASKFILVTESPSDIINRYLPAINNVVITEPEKYDLRKFFMAKEVVPDIEAVTKNNASIDPATLVVNTNQVMADGTPAAMIKKYETGQKDGTGLVFIAENLNKVDEKATFNVCLFDIASREIIELKKMTGTVGGFGFRNYWVSSVYKVMKDWEALHGRK